MAIATPATAPQQTPSVAQAISSVSRRWLGRGIWLFCLRLRLSIHNRLPELQRRTGHSFNAEQHILTGASYGGLASLQLAWRYPQVFGKVFAQSPSVWWDNGGQLAAADRYLLTERFIEADKLPLQLFLSAGIYEQPHGAQDSKGMDGTRNLRDVLRAKGYAVTYREYAASHDYLAWRGALADGLLALLATNSP